jgi:hypothetical protein
MNCKRRVEELCRLIRELEVFEQLLRGDFEIEIRQSQADVLEQTGSGVFVQALELRICEPNVRDWVKALCVGQSEPHRAGSHGLLPLSLFKAIILYYVLNFRCVSARIA